MQYNTWIYLLGFLPLMVLFYYIVPVKHRWISLLAGSILFYYISSGKLIIFICFSAFTVYLSALKIGKDQAQFKELKSGMQKEERKQFKEAMGTRHHHILVLTVLINIGLVFFLKYRNFFAGNLNILFDLTHSGIRLPEYQLFVPLGISFYTLAAISYVTDVVRGSCKAEQNYFKVLLYLIFFPIIIEGPIEKYEELGKQTGSGHTFDYKNFCFGCQLICWGLFQKVVLADRVIVLISYVFTNYQIYTGLPVLTAIVLYTFQLYMDFSGCIDIARGSAQLFGIQLSENFKRPFFSSTVNEFWRRWHISLGRWLKDYIFFPLSLGTMCQGISKSCRKKLPRYYATTIPAIFALFFVWITNGLWHGAEWKYIFYGLYYYLLMVTGMLIEPLVSLIYNKLSINKNCRLLHFLRIVRTFLFVNIGMLIFRAKDLKTAFDMFLSIFVPYHFKTNWFYWLIERGNIRRGDLLLIGGSVLFLIIYGLFKEKGGSLREELAKKPIYLRWTLYMTLLLLVIMFGAYGPGYGMRDFIYAQF